MTNKVSKKFNIEIFITNTNTSFFQNAREQYMRQCARGDPSAASTFAFAHAMIGSKNKLDVKEGIVCLESEYKSSQLDSFTCATVLPESSRETAAGRQKDNRRKAKWRRIRNGMLIFFI